MRNKSHIILTIDVEDWFQVENFKPWIPFSSWDHCDLRVEKNIHRLLDLFDEAEVRGQSTDDGGQRPEDREHTFMNAECGMRNAESESSKENTPTKEYEQSTINYELKRNGQLTTDHGQRKKVKATFFVLGWIAEKLPHLIREIHARGHEVASHGCDHRLSNQLMPDILKTELNDSKNILEGIIGAPVYGFRAPSFSISHDALKVIQDCGYYYDSSYNSFRMHARYGQVNISEYPKNGICVKISENFYELPVSNLKILNQVIPFAGGAYFRILPYLFFKFGVQSILRKEKAYLFYFHPWEIDAAQPKVVAASIIDKFKHYHNLDKTTSRLQKFLKTFSACQFISCKKYLSDTSTTLNKLDS
jgi:polysaccharide deacetylase family protein (PEP-CTERM system associated)